MEINYGQVKMIQIYIFQIVCACLKLLYIEHCDWYHVIDCSSEGGGCFAATSFMSLVDCIVTASELYNGSQI